MSLSRLGLPLPRSLRWQFTLALLAVMSLVVAAGLLAVGALQVNAETTHQLADDRLSKLEKSQELVRRALLIGREAERIAKSASADDLHVNHTAIIDHLQRLDRLVEDLVASSDDPTVLNLHQSAQLFRNNIHIAAELREGIVSGRRGTPGDLANLHRVNDSLQWQATAMAVAAQDILRRHSEEYRDAVDRLVRVSQRDQARVLYLLIGSLILAWLVSHYLLGWRLLRRLGQVSQHLRRSDGIDASQSLPVHGDDEIADMARAVEQFLADRRRLAEAHAALTIERERQEELIAKLAQAQNQLLQSEKLAAIGQLAAGVAHEINNPIGFVSSNLGTLKRYVVTLLEVQAAYEAAEVDLPAARRAIIAELRQRADLEFVREDTSALVQESIEGLQRVTRIVQDLKNFAHVDEAEVQWADLEQGLDSTLNVAWNEIKYKAEVIKDYGGVPKVECIASQINQVFMNLLVNAAQAIQEKGRITLCTRQNGDCVVIEITDTGCGISPEHQKKIFDPFFTTKPVGKGTGLGLSLAYGIIKKHGGRIDVDSEVGVGTTFRVTLPIRAVKSFDSSTTSAHPRPD